MQKIKTYDMVITALFAVVLAVCSWISIPTVVPFTMQTFGLFLTLSLLGGRRGTMAVLLYILLGVAGLPVFAGFKGGLGVLLGTTGGYILGFLCSGLIYRLIEKFLGNSGKIQAVAMFFGMIAYYVFGTLWFMCVYTKTTGAVGLLTVLSWCVFPFIIPDLIKMGLALFLSSRVRRVGMIRGEN